MFLRKALAGNAPGHSWTEDGQVIEVEDELAVQLLRIPHGGFSIAESPAPEPEHKEELEKPREEESIHPAFRNKGGRPPKPRDKHGNIIRD